MEKKYIPQSSRSVTKGDEPRKQETILEAMRTREEGI